MQENHHTLPIRTHSLGTGTNSVRCTPHASVIYADNVLTIRDTNAIEPDLVEQQTDAPLVFAFSALNWQRAKVRRVVFGKVFDTPVTVDYLAIYGHQLGSLDGAHVFLQGAAHTDISTAFTMIAQAYVSDDAPIILRFAPTQLQSLRLNILGLEEYGVIQWIQVGQAMPLPTGLGLDFQIPHRQVAAALHTNISDGGHVLGHRTIAKGVEIPLSLSLFDPQQAREFDTIKHRLISQPFLLQWSSNHYPDEVAYCYLRDGYQASFVSAHHQKITLPITAIFS